MRKKRNAYLPDLVQWKLLLTRASRNVLILSPLSTFHWKTSAFAWFLLYADAYPPSCCWGGPGCVIFLLVCSQSSASFLCYAGSWSEDRFKFPVLRVTCPIMSTLWHFERFVVFELGSFDPKCRVLTTWLSTVLSWGYWHHLKGCLVIPVRRAHFYVFVWLP